jgi:hypothetical protein
MWRAALVTLLAFAASARAEYMPGFSLYGHVAASDRILEVEISPAGRARVVASFFGEGRAGDRFDVDRDALGHRPGATTRAIVFLKGDRPHLEGAGVVWITEKEAFYLPDNWGWGMAYVGDLVKPDEFRKAVWTAVADRKAIARLAKMKPGADRAAAACRLLEQRRPECAWYRFDGFALDVHFGVDWDEWPEIGNYLTELRLALARVVGDLAAEEAAVLLRRIEKLEPGDLRREYIELVSAHAARAYELIHSCYKTAADRDEKTAAARALLRADPERATKMLVADARADAPRLARRLLDALAGAPYEPTATGLDLAARLGRELLERKESSEGSDLGHRVGEVLRAGRRKADLPVLLAMARSSRAYAAQSLVHLQELTGEDWKAADPRWDELVSKR